MHWVLIIFGIVLGLIAAGCFVYRRSVSKEAALMAATPTSRAADVAALTPGSVVEVIGTLRCASPVTGEFSNKPCAYFKAEIVRETTYYDRDSQGKNERRTDRSTVHSNVQFAPSAVEDPSGKVALNLDGAEVEGEQAVKRQEREHFQQGLTEVLINLTRPTGDSQLHYSETILTADIPVYVLGQVQTDHSVGKPSEGSQHKIFVVSRKSKEERRKSLGRSMMWLMVAGIVAAAAGLALVAWGVSSSP